VRAEVSADDISLTCDHAAPVVSYLDHSLVAVHRAFSRPFSAGGRTIAPGDTAGLVLSLRNYGSVATDARVTLSTADPYLEIHKSTAELGTILTGAIVDNQHSPFVISVLVPAPLGRLMDMIVSVSHDGTTTVSHFPLCIGSRHFLVWDPTVDASSGPVIYRTLQGLGYSGRYTTTLTAEALADCQTLWASLGVYPLNRSVPAGSPEAQAIGTFLAEGGGAYLEGGDVWHHDPPLGGHDFRPLFGLDSYSDGWGSMYQVVGEPGTFTEGMLMSHHGETNSIDRLGPRSTSFRLMRNNAPTYHVMIANDPGPYCTIGSSIEFASMRDATYPSTKAEFARQCMFFFLLRDPQQVDPGTGPGSALTRVVLAPNPCVAGTLLSCRVLSEGQARLDLYDAGGRFRRTLLPGLLAPGPHQLWLDTKTLGPGCYFVGTSNVPSAKGSKLLIVR